MKTEMNNFKRFHYCSVLRDSMFMSYHQSIDLPVQVSMFQCVHVHHWFPRNLFLKIFFQEGLFSMVLISCFIQGLRKGKSDTTHSLSIHNILL